MQERDQEHYEEIERWSQQLNLFVRRSIEVVAGVAALFLLLQGLGIRGVTLLTWDRVVAWLSTHGVRIVLVLIGAYVLTRVLQQLTERLHLLVVPGEGSLAEVGEQRKRATTITRLLNILATVVVISVAVLIVLRELNVDITPILAGAGILGLAVGFGAQNLVRDVISGLFIILDDQIRIGDVAIINGKGGLVEAIRLRTVVLRGLDGTVHIIQNGAITELSNMTKGFSQYVIDVGVAYKEDTDRVTEVLKEVGAKLQGDPAYADKILAPLEILGVDDFADSAVIIKIRIKTAPIHQWTVGRELRRRIKKAFDEQGIEIPFPHLSVYFGEASKPFVVKEAEQVARRE
ncbi:MAG: mechanosensitive ion channel family protein [Acidobacteria bacterium]|nr:mechanosensitive ion channel family protein [Acidobacteriota bacterium]